MIVLQYIYSCSKRFQTFVANRLSVIHDWSMPRQWRKVDTKDNPADDVSRGLNGFEMISNHRYVGSEVQNFFGKMSLPGLPIQL